VYSTQREDAKRTEPGSAQWCPVTDQGQWAQTETQAVLSEHQETLCHCEGNLPLAQVAQGGCGVSILGDTQNPAGHGHARMAVVDFHCL